MPSPKGVRGMFVPRAMLKQRCKRFFTFLCRTICLTLTQHGTSFLALCFHISTTLCGSWTKSTLCNWHVKINFWQWSSSCVYFASFHFLFLPLRRRTTTKLELKHTKNSLANFIDSFFNRNALQKRREMWKCPFFVPFRLLCCERRFMYEGEKIIKSCVWKQHQPDHKKALCSL